MSGASKNANYDAVRKLLEEHGRLSTVDIHLMSGIEVHAMHHILYRLVDADIAHYVQRGRGAKPGILAFGPDPHANGAKGSGEAPFRPVVQSWAPDARRDPLVAALFGEVGAI